jgi:hypothetical protein
MMNPGDAQEQNSGAGHRRPGGRMVDTAKDHAETFNGVVAIESRVG